MLKTVSKLFLLSTVLFFFSCATPRVEMPVYEGIDVRDALYSRNSISVIDTAFSITFEKDDTEIRGDGVLNIAQNGNLSMRVYSFGFLVFEITSENGIIKSAPTIDRNKSTIFTYGLRDCLFWWDLKDFDISEKDGNYLLRNLSRKVWIDGKTLFPLRQIISLEDGRELDVSYENPEKAGDIWYPSKIRIALSRYSVTLKIKDISFVKI